VLKDYILENSPRIKRLVSKGERDRRAGRVTPLEKVVARPREQVA
jgi:hypothetical protein